MIRAKKYDSIRDAAKRLLLLAVLLAAAGAAAWFFLGREKEEDAPEVSGDVYICGGCGKEYVDRFPCVSPWAGYPTEVTPVAVSDIGRETYRNGSFSGATPAGMYQYVTGNLASRDDLDVYRLTAEASGVSFTFSFEGSTNGYTYLWDAAVYGADGETQLLSGQIPLKENGETTFGVTGLEPGTGCYLVISRASGGNPFLNGFSDADYHICFLPICGEHGPLTEVLTAAPTCFQPGELTTVCDTCGTVVSTEALEPLEHIWSEYRLTEENFFSPLWGSYSRTCALCGGEETGTVLFHCLRKDPKPDPEALTVLETWTESGDSSCVEATLEKTACSVCGNVEVIRTEAGGHTFGKWETAREATCTEEGERTRTCRKCGCVETETLECVPHDYGRAERVSGSLPEGPVVVRKVCAECGYVLTEESVLSRRGFPAVIGLGAAAAAGLLFLVCRALRALRGKAAKKRQQRTFLCPCCIRTSRIAEAQFQCTNPRCKERFPLSRARGVKRDARGLPVSARCSCGQTTHEIVCPKCRRPLPASTLRGKDLIISIVGSCDTGKTHFAAVLINELIGRIIPAFGGSFEGFKDTTERYTRTYKEPLYKFGTCFERTRSAAETRGRPEEENLPLIYTLKLPVKGPLGLGKKVQMFTLVFFDSAGEDLQSSEENMRRLNRYICMSKGVVFLLDPLKIPAVRARLDEGEVRRASHGDWYQPDDILVRVSNLIRREQGVQDSEKIQVPVSVVFSKFDMVEPLIPRGCTVLEPSPHCGEGAFDLSDWHNVNTEVQGLLRTWEAESFLRQLEMNYKNYSCFAVSALGLHNNPDAGGRISRPHPHRIEDPLLWILMKRKIIKAKKKK